MSNRGAGGDAFAPHTVFDGLLSPCVPNDDDYTLDAAPVKLEEPVK